MSGSTILARIIALALVAGPVWLAYTKLAAPRTRPVSGDAVVAFPEGDPAAPSVAAPGPAVTGEMRPEQVARAFSDFLSEQEFSMNETGAAVRTWVAALENGEPYSPRIRDDDEAEAILGELKRLLVSCGTREKDDTGSRCSNLAEIVSRVSRAEEAPQAPALAREALTEAVIDLSKLPGFQEHRASERVIDAIMHSYLEIATDRSEAEEFAQTLSSAFPWEAERIRKTMEST